MVELLKKEQVADDDKKEYCEKTIDETEDKVKTLELQISDLSKVIDDENEAIATLKDEIKALEDGIVALDKAVAEATEQRKEEYAEFVEIQTNDNAAKELLAFAKNRLNKFYNPKLYKAPPKRALQRRSVSQLTWVALWHLQPPQQALQALASQHFPRWLLHLHLRLLGHSRRRHKRATAFLP